MRQEQLLEQLVASSHRAEAEARFWRLGVLGIFAAWSSGFTWQGLFAALERLLG